MFARYKISVETVEKLLEEKYLLVESTVAATENKVSEQVTKLFSPNNGILNGDALQDDVSNLTEHLITLNINILG